MLAPYISKLFWMIYITSINLYWIFGIIYIKLKFPTPNKEGGITVIQIFFVN